MIWHFVDGLPFYSLESRPNTSIFNHIYLEYSYENLMQDVRNYITNSMDTVGTYLYYLEVPTKTNKCVSIIGIGISISYFKIRTSIPEQGLELEFM